jgi:hypothetical protein
LIGFHVLELRSLHIKTDRFQKISGQSTATCHTLAAPWFGKQPFRTGTATDQPENPSYAKGKTIHGSM